MENRNFPIFSYLPPMKRILLALSILISAIACSPQKDNEMTSNSTTYSFLIGSYTDSEDQGIYQLDFNPEDSTLEVRTILREIQNPSYLIANKNADFIFSVEELSGEKGGKVLSLSRNQKSDSVARVDEVPSFGNDPCYLALSPDEKFLTVANYSGGNLSIYGVDDNAKLTHLQTIQHEGSSTNLSRQESAHVHSTVFSTDGNYLLVADLGTDEIYIYDVDKNSKEPLTLNNAHKVKEGEGPRHILFSDDNQEIVVIEELTGNLDVFSFQDGKLNLTQSLSILAEGFSGAIGAAEIRRSPDGKHIYASNRGDANTINVFGKNEEGKYYSIQQISSGGVMPRNFNLTSDGLYLLAAHQASNDIVVFKRNSDTGELSQTPWKVQVNKPVYLHRLPL